MVDRCVRAARVALLVAALLRAAAQPVPEEDEPSDDGYLRVEQQAEFQRRYHDDAPPAPNPHEARAREHDMSRWRDDVDESHYLWIAAANGDDYAMLHHLRAGADVGFREKGGPDGLETTPLHIASQRGHLACVRVLIEHGAGVDLADKRGDTPLIEAAAHGHLDVVRMLLDAGADVRLRNNDGQNAADGARAYGRCVECARLLDGRLAALPGEDLGPPLETALLEVLERAGLGDLEPALRRQGVLTVDDLAWKSGVQVMRLTGLERPHAQSLKRLAEDVAVERQNAKLPDEEHDEL